MENRAKIKRYLRQVAARDGLDAVTALVVPYIGHWYRTEADFVGPRDSDYPSDIERFAAAYVKRRLNEDFSDALEELSAYLENFIETQQRIRSFLAKAGETVGKQTLFEQIAEEPDDSLVFTNVERVYVTRIDASNVPGRARLAQAVRLEGVGI